MSPHTSQAQSPEQWPAEFTRHLNSGDLEAILALYDPDARFVTRSGDVLAEREKIRAVLAGLIGAQTKLQSNVVQAVTVGDVALLYTNFDGTTVNERGASVPMRSSAVEVLRRQPDGSWKLIIGDPQGRGS